jgi:ABC-type lipoprotein export system ATPase subunit
MASDETTALLRQVANEWGRAVVRVTHALRIAAQADRPLHASVKDGAVVDETRLDAHNFGNVGVVADEIKTIR